MSHNSRVRTAYFISTVSVALVLFLVGATAYIIMNIEKAADGLIEQVKLSAILNDDITEGRLDSLQREIVAIEGVNAITYTSKNQAAEEFKEFIGSDFTLVVEENPLPASLEISFDDSVNESEIIDKVVSKVGSMDGISEVLAHSNVVAQVMDNIFQFKVIMFGFGGALFLISLLLINNTIRAAILSKRFIIKTMTLVGATNSFIRAPFLRSAFWQGIWAVLIASIALSALIFALKRTLPEIELIVNDWQRIGTLFGGMLLSGVVLCVISTAISVNRYIRLDNNNLNTY